VSLIQVLVVLAAGFVRRHHNAIVGSGSLVTLPVMLSLGFTPLVANVTKTVGVAFGNLSGVAGYRRELAGQRLRVVVAAAGLVAIAKLIA
jgi:uncharacterized membrane protein YfcA